jgi:hypothetical protein
MHNIKCLLAAASGAALFALAACNPEPETIESGPADPQAAELAKKAPVALPPSIVSSHAYRCKDNSLVYVDFMSDQKTAVYRTKKGGDATVLTAPEPGKAYVADGGYSVTGGGTSISVTAPGRGTQSCKA